MKESRYNLQINHNGQKYLFNSRKCTLGLLDENGEMIMNSLDEISNTDEEISPFINGGFIVDDEYDELAEIIEQFRYYKNSMESLELTIAPTLACNLNCEYCFENKQSGIMNDKCISSILALIEKNAKKNRKVSILWFGGEPLLAKDIVNFVSQKAKKICNDNNVDYSSSIITNGTLIDEATVNELIEAGIEHVQLTIDGIPSTHNKRKKYVNSNLGTFNKIVENASRIIRTNKIKTTIRINIDKENEHELNEVLWYLAKSNLHGCNVVLGQITSDTEGSSSVIKKCLDDYSFASRNLAFQKMIKEYGMCTEYPQPKGIFCGACNNNSFVIDSWGYVYKCFNDIGEKKSSICQIDELVQNDSVHDNEYIDWDMLECEKCIDCKFLPICMGGCVYKGLKQGTPVCDINTYIIEDLLKLKIDALVEQCRKEVNL